MFRIRAFRSKLGSPTLYAIRRSFTYRIDITLRAAGMDMAYHYETLHNFRALRKTADSRSLIYRSARQEKISQEETKVNIYNTVGYNDL